MKTTLKKQSTGAKNILTKRDSGKSIETSSIVILSNSNTETTLKKRQFTSVKKLLTKRGLGKSIAAFRCISPRIWICSRWILKVLYGLLYTVLFPISEGTTQLRNKSNTCSNGVANSHLTWTKESTFFLAWTDKKLSIHITVHLITNQYWINDFVIWSYLPAAWQ